MSNNADGCCVPAMCAAAGTSLNCIFSDISTLVKPFTPAITAAISPQKTTASTLGLSGNQLFMFGLLALVAIVLIEGGL